MRFTPALFLMTAAACTPASRYRFSGLVPAAHPLSWDGRTAEEGRLRLEGTLTGDSIRRNLFPQLHDSALRVPSMTLEGAATIAVSQLVEIGGRFTYAAYAWSDESASGTPPIPSRPSVAGFGPEVRLAIPLDRPRRFALGLGANLLAYTIPHASWQRVASCVPDNSCFIDPSAGAGAAYSLSGEGSETHWATTFAIYPSVNLAPDGSRGHVFCGVSAHTAYKNDGFTNSAQAGSAPTDAGWVVFVGAGYGVAIGPARLSAMLSRAMTGAGSPVDYGFAGFMSVGVDAELWRGREERERQPAREPTTE